MRYLTSNNEAAIIAIEHQISINCRLPNGCGTENWATVTKAINDDLWFIEKPSSDGWGNLIHYTQEGMMENVDLTDITELERDEAWFPMAEI